MAKIASVKRMAVHDGPGLRTTLFLKGCPLHCLWCHNPECISFAPQTAYIEKKCLGCGECADLCPANQMTESGHIHNRTLCTACGHCETACLGNAFTFYGREMSPEEAADILLEDRAFYQSSNGGITLSGGEPLAQADFSAALLKRMKAENIHTCVDTCGFVPWSAIEGVIPYTDLFLYDMKAASGEVHQKCTGQPNDLIVQNLQKLSMTGAKIEIRVPCIPTFNDGEMEGIARILASLDGITLVRLLPYHPYAASKYESLGLSYAMPGIARPSREEMAQWVSIFTQHGLNAVDGGNLP